MNRRGFANIILVIVVVAIVAAAGYFLFIRKSAPPITTNPLNPITTSTAAQKNSSAPTEKPGWKAIVWHDPQNKILVLNSMFQIHGQNNSNILVR